MNNLCIYHGNCADGFGAAWVVRKAWEDGQLSERYSKTPPIEYYPGVYQNQPPWSAIEGNRVIIVDFSYSPEIMEQIYDRARELVWIDHHKSAIQAMHDFYKGRPRFTFRTSLEHSGATLTWQHFFPHQTPPQLLDHIEDRDLWRFKLAATREIQAAVFSYPYDFQVWDKLMTSAMLPELIRDGMPIERKHHKDVKELIDVTTRFMKIGEKNPELVPVANLPYTMASDGGHLLCTIYQDTSFAATYYDKIGGRVFSLRSLAEGGRDVSEVAKEYGGGGHKNSAGFTVPPGHPLAKA